MAVMINLSLIIFCSICIIISLKAIINNPKGTCEYDKHNINCKFCPFPNTDCKKRG